MFLFRLADFPVLFPVRLLPQTAVGVEPRGMDRSLVRRGVHGAVRLVPMRAVREPARPEIRLKLREAILQLCRADGFHLLDIKGAKARRIGDVPAVRQSKKLHVARRVAAAAELFAHVAGLELQRRSSAARGCLRRSKWRKARRRN